MCNLLHMTWAPMSISDYTITRTSYIFGNICQNLFISYNFFIKISPLQDNACSGGKLIITQASDAAKPSTCASGVSPTIL